MSTYTPTNTSSTTALISMPTIVPTPSRKIYIRTGIGGAGNYKPSSSSSTTQKPTRSYTHTLTQLKPLPRTTGTFLTGIGGSGNSRRYEEQASLTYKEQVVRKQLIRDNAPMAYHHGVGGAGNCAAAATAAKTFNGSRASRDSSGESSSSSFSGSESLSGLEKMMGKRDSYRRL